MRITTLIPLFVILCVMTCVAPSPVQAQVPARQINWSQPSSGYVFRWNDRDLTVTKAATGKNVYSFVETVKREVGKVAADDIVTPREADRSGPAESVRTALQKDAVVRRILQRENIAPPPTLDGLLKALANRQFGGEDDNLYLFPSDLLESFAFHHVEDGKASVRFLLPHGSEIYRFRNTQRGVLLPVSVRLKTAFAQAAAGKNGVLMQSLRRSAFNVVLTNVVLHSRTDAQAQSREITNLPIRGTGPRPAPPDSKTAPAPRERMPRQQVMPPGRTGLPAIGTARRER